MQVKGLDHIVLTVKDIEATCKFYGLVLGIRVIEFNGGRKALSFGSQKINLHQYGNEFEPKAARPTPGSADLCFIVAQPLAEVIAHLNTCKVEIEAGPLQRTGAVGPINSLYFRDLDGNLLEVSNYLDVV